MKPESIDRYQIEEEIGRGGMATVYKAFDPRFERHVAVKVLPRELMHDPEFQARFHREAKTIAALEHPAIVPVYDYGEDDGLLYLVMRFMPGGSLAERLEKGPLTIDEAATILQRLGSALDRAHGQGIIHRDLKPSNVLFDQYGDAFLADFGIVRVTSSDSNLTASGSLVGTPTYMSPEQVYGDRELDGRSDIYALGVILFQMLTGHLPYEADTPAKMMMKHVLEPVPRILKNRPDLPPEAEEVVSKALAKQPDDRFATASDLTSALNTLTQKSKVSEEFQAHLATIQADIAPELAGLAALAPSQAPDESPDEMPNEAVPQTLQETTAVSTPPKPTKPTKPITPTDSPPPDLADVVLAEMNLPPAPEKKPEPEPPPAKRRIPLWVWGSMGVLFLLCICLTAVAGFLISNQDEFAQTNTATPAATTATPVTFPLLDAGEIAAATQSAALAATREAIAAATAAPTTEPATPSPAENGAAATRASLSATREAAAATPTEPAGADLAGTRASLAATRQGPGADSGVTAVFGPQNGALPHEEDDTIEAIYSDVTLSNFVARASLLNPYAAADQGWDFGLIFRQTAVDDELRLVIRSDGDWNLNNRQGNNDTFVQEGNVGDLLALGENGRNDLLLIAHQENGYFFLNNQFVARLDLIDRTDFGNLALGTGFYSSNERAGETTRYEAFAVWPHTPLVDGREGLLEHIDDGFIKLQRGDVDIANFVARATFKNPADAADASWDWGFAFREQEEEYWLIIESGGAWTLVDRRADDDYFSDEGLLTNLYTGLNESNNLTLIALEERGYFFLNDQFIAELDLSGRLTPGDISVTAAFFTGNELPGTTTTYEDFSIWPLP